ncbi:MAG: hypothetical protein GY910_22915 [bacterium]|nr:hypothetical protein [Deltaproteobacteria bacterium]MCP4907834.1 hypothetical protein [bacterium]
MSVYIDVWHRTHPLTPAAHARFLDYYATNVVSPPSAFFEVVGGFRYTDGTSNEDFALYRYESMAKIEESMMSFGADPDFLSATETIFADIDIEETRGIAIHAPYSPEERLDEIISERAPRGAAAASTRLRRYVRIVRTSGGMHRPRAFEALGILRDQVEKAGSARLVTSFHYLVGPVMDLVELWVLPEGAVEWPQGEDGGDSGLKAELAEIAPERERRGLVPTAFSKLR